MLQRLITVIAMLTLLLPGPIAYQNIETSHPTRSNLPPMCKWLPLPQYCGKK